MSQVPYSMMTRISPILKNGTSTKHDEAFVADANGHATFKLQVSNGNPFHKQETLPLYK